MSYAIKNTGIASIAKARNSVKKNSLGTQALMGVVHGATKVTGQIAGAVERATDYSKKIARKDDEPAPEKDDNSAMGVVKRTWKTLTDPEYAKKKALENTREHHRQLAPVTDKLNDESRKIRKETESTADKINAKQGTTGHVVSKATEMIPEVMSAGSSTRARVANNVIGAIKDYGENKSIPGAIAKLLMPGNSKTANVASSLLGDTLAEARNKALSSSK